MTDATTVGPEAGHMTYIESGSLAKLKSDVSAFIERALWSGLAA